MPQPRRHGLLILSVVAALALATGLGVVLLTTPASRAAPVPTATQRPAPSTSPHLTAIAFLGDSWTEGVGGTNYEGYAPRTAARLGWHYLNFGVGGSGYTHPGADDSLFAQRIAAVVASHADVIVVQGSLNDRSSTPTAEAAAAYTTLRLLHEESAPGTRIIVLGASYTPGTPNATIDWINAAVRSGANRVGLPFVDPATLDWTDPRDPTIWSDPLHPNDSGHQRIANHLAPLIRNLVQG